MRILRKLANDLSPYKQEFNTIAPGPVLLNKTVEYIYIYFILYLQASRTMYNHWSKTQYLWFKATLKCQSQI